MMDFYDNGFYLKADNLSVKAKPLFPLDVEGSFTMYSFDTISYLVIKGIALNLFERGFSEEEVKAVLQSKQIRWMLDGVGEELIGVGYKLAEKHLDKL